MTQHAPLGLYDALGITESEVLAAYKQIRALLHASMDPNPATLVAALLFSAVSAKDSGFPCEIVLNLVRVPYDAEPSPAKEEADLH